jgi:hypothetical protein
MGARSSLAHDILALCILGAKRRDHMASFRNDPEGLTVTESALMDILQREGAQTIESLVRHTGFEWTQVFGAVDNLSRSGALRLRRVQGGHYRVSLNESPA